MPSFVTPLESIYKVFAGTNSTILLPTIQNPLTNQAAVEILGTTDNNLNFKSFIVTNFVEGIEVSSDLPIGIYKLTLKLSNGMSN